MNQTAQALTINDYLEGRVTLSELIKYAVNKVLTQDDVAYDATREVCLYRAANGAQCAVGGILPEEVREPYTLDRARRVLDQQFNVPPFSKLTKALAAMQRIHDGAAMLYGRGKITRTEFNERFSQDMSTFEEYYSELFDDNIPEYHHNT